MGHGRAPQVSLAASPPANSARGLVRYCLPGVDGCWTLVVFMVVLGTCWRDAVADPIEDGRLWVNVTAQGGFADAHAALNRWRWYLELQPRWREGGEEVDQLLVRPGVSFKVSDAATLWFGYGNVFSYPAVGDTVHENRLWQQYLYKFKPVARVALTSRTRLEERWLKTGNDTGVRVRQMLRLDRPFESRPALSAVIWNEFFVNANSADWGAHDGFDQNRAFAGLSYMFATLVRFNSVISISM